MNHSIKIAKLSCEGVELQSFGETFGEATGRSLGNAAPYALLELAKLLRRDPSRIRPPKAAKKTAKKGGKS
jgi:hypothetical protein